MLKIKDGVKIFGVRPELIVGIMICDGVFDRNNLPCILTSVTEGPHSRGSFHYNGLAFDLRTRHIPSKTAVDKIFIEVKDALSYGDEWDVVLEKNHIHIEFQPKR